MIDIQSCPACGGDKLTNYNQCIDYTVSHETFSLLKCTTCDLVVTSPRPHEEDLGKYYQSNNYISHSGKASTVIDKVYLVARNFTLKKKLALLNRYKANGTLLDYGCGTGEFLNTCKSNGWEINGLEPSSQAREKATQLTQEKIYSSLKELPNNLDVITLWHVLEHVPLLEETLEKLTSLLKKDGIIFIAVPNYKSFDAQHYKNFWAAYDVPRHLWHFDQNSMKRVLDKKNLKLEAVLPMKLDSYYVSMLSEKYKNDEKTSLLGLIKAFLIGLRSNLHASKTGNYSSLIYIARK